MDSILLQEIIAVNTIKNLLNTELYTSGLSHFSAI